MNAPKMEKTTPNQTTARSRIWRDAALWARARRHLESASYTASKTADILHCLSDSHSCRSYSECKILHHNPLLCHQFGPALSLVDFLSNVLQCNPSDQPSAAPSRLPSSSPSMNPTSQPTRQPSCNRPNNPRCDRHVNHRVDPVPKQHASLPFPQQVCLPVNLVPNHLNIHQYRPAQRL